VRNLDKETKQMFELILQKLDNMEKRQENMEKRQDEIYSVVKSIEHSNNVRKAEIDNLTYKVAHVEGTINGVGELIEKRRSIK
jgi:hypothetical protein